MSMRYSCPRRQRRSDDPGVVQHTLTFATMTAETGSNVSCCHCLVRVIAIILAVFVDGHLTRYLTRDAYEVPRRLP